MTNSSALLELGIKKRNKEIDISWEELALKHSNGKFCSGETYRCWVKRQLKFKGELTKKQDYHKTSESPSYKEEVEIHRDGTQSSNKLVRMSIEQSKDEKFLLKAHGYDLDSWELISAKSNIWNAYSKSDGISTLYSSKISVRPKRNGFNYDRFIESLREIKPYSVQYQEKSPITEAHEKRLLEISLYDTHFGVSDYEYYFSTQQRIATKIASRQWEEILFVVGQDMLHNDNFRGQTSSGTLIETVDMEKAWDDCRKFYEPLIKLAFENANNVKIVYSKGNHDESMSWAFVQLLKALFPFAKYDDSFTERKAHVFGNIFIGITHGDKGRKQLHNLFPVEFPELWARAKIREVHVGHLHVEDGRDYFGMMVRTLATRNKTDKWHQDNGYIGAHKRFMLFEYSESELESIHYV
ncbi:hypothetical protein [Paenibacillus xylaniclasticus]|uniref:hypothetical protein n=1 Tax=Paenibacillus xylaniclasticus TaxID=588083 RepID=UPI000FDC2B7C|nr:MULTISPECIES: hypothetical protein [Paenibacillus]GFN32585.1 hypothetical protein PCURB6_28450 [Paenibacillus curdlanolyticus]